jgi:hypothetical protein
MSEYRNARDIKMIVLPRPASKRPRAPLTCRYMCIRCGQVISSTPDKLAEDMEPHFTDKLRFGCPHVSCLEATFERDFSLGYCSSAQGEAGPGGSLARLVRREAMGGLDRPCEALVYLVTV